MALHYQYRVNLLTPSNRTDSQRLTVERSGLPTLDIPLAAEHNHRHSRCVRAVGMARHSGTSAEL